MDAAPVDDGLELAVLGTLEVRRHGTLVDLGGPQQRAVLAHLILDAGRIVPVDRLITRIWGDDPPASALSTLQSYVSRLRRVLEPERPAGTPARVLVSEAPGYLLQVPRDQVDLFRFEALAAEGNEASERGHPAAALERFDAALALWRGSALAGLGAEASLEPVIARLEEGRSRVVEDRFDALLALGRHGAVVAPLQGAVREHPWRERLWAQLALALYRSGRQTDALRALATARSTLAEELGLDPGPELQRLEAQILAHDPALVAVPPVAHRPEPRPAAPLGLAVPALVGRRDDFARALAVLDRAAGGSPSVLLVEGEPGIGKTALLDAVTVRAGHLGWTVVWGRGVEEGLAPAMWPWAEVLRSLVGALGDALVAGRPFADDLVRLESGDDKGTATLVQMAGELAEVLVDAAVSAPLLVVMDDLHWADSISLDLLALAAERLGDARVVLAGALRPLDHGTTGPLARTLGAMGRAAPTTRVALSGLEPDEVAALMAVVGGEQPTADIAERVHERTAGNPLFVAEFTRLAGSGPASERALEGVPDAIRDLVRRRLARLPARTLHVLATAAVIGQDLDLRVLAAASDLTLDECLDDVDPAVVTRVLVPGDAGRFRFLHALVRDAVLVDLSPLRRARLHQRVADAIEAVFGADRDHAEPIGVHRWEGLAVDDPDRVSAALVRAGDVARRHGALDRADELLSRALEAAVRMPAGDARTAREIEIVESILSVETLRSFMGQRLDEIADRIDDVARRNNSDAARLLALFTRWSHINVGRVREVEPYAVEALTLARRSESPYLVIMGHYVWGVQCWATGRLPEACESFDVALGVWQATRSKGSTTARLPPLNLGGVAAFAFEAAGDRVQADFCFDVLRMWSDDRPLDRTAFIDVAFMRGMVLAVRGDAEETERITAPAVGPDVSVRLPHFSPGCAVFHGWARALRTGSRRSCQEIETALAELDAGTTRIGLSMFRSLLGAALLHVGEATEAVDVLRRARTEATTTGEVWWLPEILRLLAEALVVAGGTSDEIAGLADQAVALADAQGEWELAERARTTQRELSRRAR